MPNAELIAAGFVEEVGGPHAGLYVLRYEVFDGVGARLVKDHVFADNNENYVDFIETAIREAAQLSYAMGAFRVLRNVMNNRPNITNYLAGLMYKSMVLGLNIRDNTSQWWLVTHVGIDPANPGAGDHVVMTATDQTNRWDIGVQNLAVTKTINQGENTPWLAFKRA